MNFNPYLPLIGSLLLALGGMGTHVAMDDSWATILKPSFVFQLLMTIGGVLMAWKSQSPRTKWEESYRKEKLNGKDELGRE